MFMKTEAFETSTLFTSCKNQENKCQSITKAQIKNSLEFQTNKILHCFETKINSNRKFNPTKTTCVGEIVGMAGQKFVFLLKGETSKI